MKISFRIFCLLMFISSCLLAGTPRTTPSQGDAQAEPEEYAVYSAAISNAYGSAKEIKLVLISEEIKGFEISQFGKDHFAGFLKNAGTVSPGQVKELIDDFSEKNRHSVRLQKRFDLKIPYMVVGQEAFGHIASSDNFYPGAVNVMSFSRIGFNSDKNLALMHRKFFCGMVCGGVDGVLLMKKNNVWAVVNVERFANY